MKRPVIYIIAVAAILLLSCSDGIEKKIEQIKAVGNTDPAMALMMLDSIDIQIREEPEHTRMKYDLLRIRLNDKAYNIPASDIPIRKCLEYFEAHGSDREKQEAYYYAGSVYRDLKDSPRAIEYFLKACELAQNMEDCDSVLLCNTYSNLNWLYSTVQDYTRAIQMAEKEVEISKRTNTELVTSYLHVGACCVSVHMPKKASLALDSAYQELIRQGIRKDQESLVYLMNGYLKLGNIDKATECFTYLDREAAAKYTDIYNVTMGSYFKSTNHIDSAIIYQKKALQNTSDVNCKYDASKELFEIYRNKGDYSTACDYGYKYLLLSDSMDFGRRQDMAATVNNRFQYHLDKNKEENLKLDRQRYKYLAMMAFIASLLIISITLIIFVYKRNRDLKEALRLTSELERISSEDASLREKIESKENEIRDYEKSLSDSTEELENVRCELEQVNKKLAEYKEELKNKEKELADKIEQNVAFIKLLHKSEIEGSAEDVVDAIRQSGTGRKNMSAADWRRLYKAVDELHPDFKSRIIKELGQFTEQQLQVCYLMRIGLSKTQIQNMTDLSRVTVWRWVKKFEWIHDSDA